MQEKKEDEGKKEKEKKEKKNRGPQSVLKVLLHPLPNMRTL